MRLVARVKEPWRDRVLTGLTLLVALNLFVVVPLGAIHDVSIRPISVTLVLLLVCGLLVVSQSVVPAVGVVASLLLLGTAMIARAHGGGITLEVCFEATGWLLVGLVTIWVVARAVFGPGRITYHRVVGAILLYLAIGFVFVALYTLVAVLAPGAFAGFKVEDRVSLPPDLVYFSFATITTVGYGDLVPVHPFARSLSNLEAILGQLYPATLLARMVSLELRSG
ncbi:MAG TPA: ion channel [Reyranella sp.]|nr:ion channel [Reyranella sp.]